MNKVFSKLNSNEFFGTSFHFGYVKGTAEEISKVLGPCEDSYDDNTCREWDRKVNGIVFTIYDYKEYKDISDSDVIEYHIGTKTDKETERVVNILKDCGLNAYIMKFF